MVAVSPACRCPEPFLSAATAMLAQYTEQVAAQACDPVRGPSAKSKGFPRSPKSARPARRTSSGTTRAGPHPRGGGGPQTPVGSLEQKRVVAGYAELQEKLLANAPPDPRPKPFSRKLKEGKDAFTGGPLASTTDDFAKYLAGMLKRDNDLNTYGEASHKNVNCP
jgi:hypothetical protein